MTHLTSREMIYLGGKCQWRHPETGDRPCWNPITHRIQRGPYSWWFVCFDHIEAVAIAYHGDPNDGEPKSRVRKLARSADAAAWAGMIYSLGFKLSVHLHRHRKRETT